MKTFSSILLAVALLAGFAALAPSPAQAVPWCQVCDDTGDCFACCRCAGGSVAACFNACGGAAQNEATLAADEEPMCSAAPSQDDALQLGQPALFVENAASTDCDVQEQPEVEAAR
jgi:hypothetical protein